MTLIDIKNAFEKRMAEVGVDAEITFIDNKMFSIFVECSRAFDLAKKILSSVSNIALHSEDCDEEIGYFAYYTF